MPLNSIKPFSEEEYYKAKYAAIGQKDSNLQPTEGQPDPSSELDPTLAAAPETASNFSRGLSTGIEGLQATGGGLQALAGSGIKKLGDAVGSESLAETGSSLVDSGMETYIRNNEEAQQYVGDVAKFEDINEGFSLQTVSNAGDWFAHALGKSIPDLALALGTGFGGGLVAKQAIKKGTQEYVDREIFEKGAQELAQAGLEKKAADYILKQNAEKMALDATSKAALKGSLVGSAGYSGFQGAGGSFADILSETGVEAPLTAVGLGIMTGGLEALPFSKFFGSMFPKGSKDEFQDYVAAQISDKPPWVTQAITDMGEAYGINVATEMVQYVINEEALTFVNNRYGEKAALEYGRYITTPEGRSELLNVAADSVAPATILGAGAVGVKKFTGQYSQNPEFSAEADAARTEAMQNDDLQSAIQNAFAEYEQAASQGNTKINIEVDQSFLDDNPPLTAEERREAGLSELTDYDGTQMDIPESEAPAQVSDVVPENSGFGENTLPPSPQPPQADIVDDFNPAPTFGGVAVSEGTRDAGPAHRWDGELSPVDLPVQEQLMQLSIKAGTPEAMDPNNTDVIVEAIDQDDVDRIFDRNESLKVATTDKPKGKSLPTIDEAYGNDASRVTDSVAGVMADLSANGVPTSFMDSVTGVYVHKESEVDAPALTGRSARGISVNEDLLNGSLTDPEQLSELAWTMTHEVYHAADFAMGLSDKDSRFGIQIDESIDEPTVVMGDIMEEIYDNWEQGSALGKRFDYPFNDLQAHILDPEKDNAKVNSTMREEVFAQLGALFHSNPKELQELAPQAYNYIKEIRDNNLQTAQAVEVNDEAPTSISTPDTSQPEGISGEVRAPPESGIVEVVQPEPVGRDGEASTGDGRADTPVAGQVQEETGQRERSDVQEPTVKKKSITQQNVEASRQYAIAQGEQGSDNKFYTPALKKDFLEGFRQGYANTLGMVYQPDEAGSIGADKSIQFSEGYYAGNTTLRDETSARDQEESGGSIEGMRFSETEINNPANAVDDTPIEITKPAAKGKFTKAENWQDTGNLVVTFADGDRYTIYFDDQAKEAGDEVYYTSVDGKIPEDQASLGQTKAEALRGLQEHRQKLFDAGEKTFNTPLDPDVGNEVEFKAWSFIDEKGSVTEKQLRAKFKSLEDNQFENLKDRLASMDNPDEAVVFEDGRYYAPDTYQEKIFGELDDPSFVLAYKPPRRTKNGKYVGSPAGIDTPAKLARIRRFVKELAKQGEYGRFWYERSGRTVLEITGGDVEEAKKIVQAIAITSPSTPVDTNYEYAIQAYYQWKNGQPIETGRFPKSMGEKITKVFNGESWSGRKTNNFEQNLLRSIDDSLDQGVTTDLWMMRAFGYTSDAATDLNYDFVENETIRIAEDLGWEPQQVQAAIWVEIKSRMESKQVKAEVDKKSELKGNYKWVTEKGKKIRNFKDLDSEKAHSTLWVNTALNYKPTEAERNTAKFDYRDATLNKMAQVSVESIPSTKSGHFPEIFSASQGEILEYHHAIEQAFLDDNGVDIVAKELGLLQMGKSQGIGAWEGRNDPVTQNEIVLPRQYREKNDGVVSDDANDLVAAYAAVKGTLLKQDGVGWHRPFFKKSNTKASQNGMHVSIGRPLNMRETRELSAALDSYGLGGNIVSTQDGVRVINYSDESGNPYSGLPNFKTGKNNLDFKDAIINSVEAMSFDGDLDAEVVGFVSANDLLENDWTENKNGEGYLQGRLRERPDLQGRVSSLITQLQPRVREVEAEFAGTYGWTRNNDLNRDFGGAVDEPSFIKRKINNAKNKTLDDGSPSTNAFSHNDEADGQSDMYKRLKKKPAFKSLVDRYAPLEEFENQAADYLEYGRLPAELSPRDQENLAHGKVQNDLNALYENYVDPIGDLIAELKLDPEAIGTYLIAKHAAERNDVIAAKVKAQRDKNIARVEKEIERLLSDTGVDHTVALETQRFKLDKYKTMPLAFQNNGSGMTYAQAESVLRLAEKEGTKADLEKVAAKVYDMLQYQRDRMVEAGLLDEDSRADWEDTYKFYVPLKGFAAEEKGDQYTRTAKARGFSIVGSESMKARGRKTLPVNPLFSAIEDVQMKIIRARKNETAQTFLDLLSKLGNSDSYTIYNNKFRPPKRSDELTMQDMDEMKNARRVNGDPEYVQVKKGGQTFFIHFKSDELNHALQDMSVAMLDRNNTIMDGALTFATKFQTFRRNMLINYNPSWGLVNPMRDVATGLIYALAESDKKGSRTQGKNLVGAMAKSYVPALRSMYRVLRGKPIRKNTLDQYAADFMADGASTGMMLVKDQAEQLRILKNKLKKSNTRDSLRYIAKWVEDFNTQMENGVRLAAYVEARKVGTDKQTAATLAKDLTVNFNRKGEHTAQVNAAFLFFNASIQGTVNIAQALGSNNGKRVTKARIAAASMVAIGAAVAYANIISSDEDDDGEADYADLPEHAKNRALLMMYDNEEGFALQLPYGYNFFTNIGRLSAEMAMGINTPEETAFHLANNVMLNFMPIAPASGDSWEEQMRGFYPDMLEVHQDLQANKNFFGSEIYIEQNPFLVERSAAYNSRRSTPKAFTATTEFLNDATGGDKYDDGFVSINPDKMKYVYEYFLGGVGRFVSQSSDVVSRMLMDEDFRKQDLPVVGTFFESPSEYEDRFEFYDNSDETEKVIKRFDEAKDAGDRAALLELNKKYRSFAPIINGGKNSPYRRVTRDLRTIAGSRKIVMRQDITNERRNELLDNLSKKENKTFDAFNKMYRKAEKEIRD